METPRPALPARPSFRRAGVSPGQACDYSSSGGVSAASANAFIEQRGVTYFNSHLFLAVVFIWNEGLAVRFGGELDTKFITKRQENEGAGNSARPFSPKASGAEHRAQVTAARVSIGGEGGEPPPLPALGGPRSVQPAAAPSRRRRWNCFSWSVCSFSLHTRGTAREETSGCQFST